MKKIKFKIAAYTDAAGKVNPEAPRRGNEDNMFVSSDLGQSSAECLFKVDKEEKLSRQGCLLAVADGMGGMNAGEVASEIAINVVRESFSADAMSEKVMLDVKSRASFMESVIVDADAAIKAHAKEHPECEGMGTTIVLVWLYDGLATVSWCGDSRAYLYRDNEGLCQISKDHSYVQGLVDAGKITAEEAFDHPYGNIITRSLGDPNSKAKPDSITVPVFMGDIILVNSDGLSGVLRDSEIAAIIRENRSGMNCCRQALWKAAEAAGWYDNVTAILCEITEGEHYDPALVKTATDSKEVLNIRVRKSTLIAVLAAVAVLIAASAAYLLSRQFRQEVDLSNTGDSTIACHPSDSTADGYVHSSVGKESTQVGNGKNHSQKSDMTVKTGQLEVGDSPEKEPSDVAEKPKNGKNRLTKADEESEANESAQENTQLDKTESDK